MIVVATFIVTHTLPRELIILRREVFAGVNRVGSYYMAYALGSFPFAVLWAVIYSLIIYFLAVPDHSSGKLLVFLGIMILANVVATCIGLLISAATMSVPIALALGK
jgi:hypothetical protein